MMQLKVLKYFFSAVIIVVLSATSLWAQSVKHEVQDEETLFSIAKEYGVTVQQLQKWNNISGNAISIGQVLIIKPPKENGGAKKEYTVKDGDTLFSIAHQFGVTVEELKEWNNLAGAAISIGQVLRIRPRDEDQPQPTTESVDKVERQPVITGVEDDYYTVKSGDTLFRIAQLFGMEVAQLKSLNDLTSNNIAVGQELKVVAGPEDLAELTVQPRVEPEATTSKAGLTVLGEAAVKMYSPTKKGTVTTNGELYNPQALTAAHAAMAIGSVIFVKNPANGQGVIVRINDRITQKNLLKLSKAAWQVLGLSSRSKVMLYRIDE